MIKVENISTFNFENALRGMRNPMNSWDKSSEENDLQLARKLYRAGTTHRKYLRQIFISMDITAPLYWWKEFDTYKVGTTSNSCSTMHKLHSRDLTLEDFSCDKLGGCFLNSLKHTIEIINLARDMYLEHKNKSDWYQMIQLLPSSYNQMRTVTMTYENAISMIEQRQRHKLSEWVDFCLELKKLPYLKDIIDV